MCILLQSSMQCKKNKHKAIKCGGPARWTGAGASQFARLHTWSWTQSLFLHRVYFHVYLYLYLSRYLYLYLCLYCVCICVFIFIYICVCTACHGPSLYFHTERIFMCICVCTCIRLYWTGAKEGLQGEPSRKLLYQDHFALLLSVFLSYICLFAGLLDCW